MSGRANRRAMRSSARSPTARSRRTPVRASGGRNIPWIPLVFVVGIAVVLAGVVYLVLQANSKPNVNNDKWANVEADPAPDLPGEFVDLQTIYNGKYGGGDGISNTGEHVTRDMDYATKQGLPPTGGPHWGSSSCGSDPTAAPPFCGPAPWGIYRDPWDAESVVHNMEHGGLVVWYNTADQQLVSDLEDVITGYLEGDALIVMMPYPEMDAETVAITAWGRREIIPVSAYNEDTVRAFIDAFKCRFNPESLPGAGC